MSMLADFVEKIWQAPQAKTFEIGGETYSDQPLQLVEPPDDPQPPSLALCSLTGITDYLGHNVDGLEIPKLYFHVESPARVALLAEIDADNSNRRVYHAIASAQDLLENCHRSIEFCPEELIIHLRSNFAHTEDLDLLMSRAGNLVHETTVSYDDDGVSANVTVKQGLTFKKAEKMPAIVLLSPYRTFREIDQPLIPYAVRIRGGGNEGQIKIRLIDASGGGWKNNTILKIKDWIHANTDGSVPVLA